MHRKFKVLDFQKANVGKRIKSTKVRYMWKFELDKKEFQIDLYMSKLSGKRTIMLNGDVYANEKKSSAVYGNYPVKVGKRIAVVYEVDDNRFDLRIENISFEAYFNSYKSESSGFSSKNSSISDSKNPIQKFNSTPVISTDFTDKTKPEIKYQKHIISNQNTEKPPMKQRVKTPEDFNLIQFASSPKSNISLPDDLFSQPLTSSKTETLIHTKYNPFDELESINHPKEVKKDPLLDLLDLGNLSISEPPIRSSNRSHTNPQVYNNPYINMQTIPSGFPLNRQDIQTTQNQMMNGMMNNSMMPMQGMINNSMMPMQGMMNNYMMAYNPYMSGLGNPWAGSNK
ncbi:hypothetical protein SteCoe_11190 [Stentor coeruleus]|uniref:Uncharacterized protein n=1 Tax=Stentor coeruleus TaxID=5963 RepID=A0A1R2CDY6_9CILI|nr:hypothetical protein SteCoe_11190 [Stentor coeruleus]